MDIITTARHFEMTPEIRAHARRRLEKLRRYQDGIDEVHVVLAVEKYRQIAEVALHARGTEILSREESDDMMLSIDRAVDRIERQIKRARGRRRSGRRGAAAPATAGPPRAAEAATGEDSAAEAALGEIDEESYPPVVVRGDQCHPDPITVEEAIEILKERGDDFLLFRNVRSEKINLVHVRADGNYGLVEAP